MVTSRTALKSFINSDLDLQLMAKNSRRMDGERTKGLQTTRGIFMLLLTMTEILILIELIHTLLNSYPQQS